MKYEGTYSCGHEGLIDIVGSGSYREWKVEKEFSGLCPECQKRKLEAERAASTMLAKNQAEELGLPQLTGSDKQIAWAERIRADFVKYAEDQLSKAGEIALKIKKETPEKSKDTDKEVLAMEKAFKAIFDNSESKFWIKNRGKVAFSDIFKQEFLKIMNKLDSENIPEDVSEENRINEEALTVKPTEIKFEGVVKFKDEIDAVSVIYVKNTTFIELVKECRYRWSGTTWLHRINEYTGTAIDREAELGNLLLKNGFMVCFSNFESREKAISGKFAPEILRWVKWNNRLNRLSLIWNGRNNSLYIAAKKIPSAKWDNGIKVDVSFYNEVLDFAETYNFNVSRQAKDEINKYKEKVEHIYEVTFADSETPHQISGEEILKKQLEKNGVIEDLLDD